MFSSNSIYCNLLCKVDQSINEYVVDNKHYLTEQIHLMIHAIMFKSEYC
jgi:hypothetical protein